jgi:hypothetical protein
LGQGCAEPFDGTAELSDGLPVPEKNLGPKEAAAWSGTPSPQGKKVSSAMKLAPATDNPARCPD